jgi:hypothetical protein
MTTRFVGATAVVPNHKKNREESDVAEKKRGDCAQGKKWAKVKPYRLRVRIVAACHLADVTPKEIAARERLPVATVQYYFSALERERWIHVCKKESIGNGVRHWYTADRFKWIKAEEFGQMNDVERYETSEGVLMHYLEICREALEEHTLDARADSHLSHTPMGLDQQGWDDVQKKMDRLLEELLEVKVEAEMRIRESGEESIPTVVHLGGFEVPRSVIARTKAHQ